MNSTDLAVLHNVRGFLEHRKLVVKRFNQIEKEIFEKLELLNIQMLDNARKEFSIDSTEVIQTPTGLRTSQIMRTKNNLFKTQGINNVKNTEDVKSVDTKAKSSSKVGDEKSPVVIGKHEYDSKKPLCSNVQASSKNSQTTECRQSKPGPSCTSEVIREEPKTSDSYVRCDHKNLDVHVKVEKGEQKWEVRGGRQNSNRFRGGRGRGGHYRGRYPNNRRRGCRYPRNATTYVPCSYFDVSDSSSTYSESELVNGFTPSEVEELLQQQVKPYDDDAASVLAFLRGGCEHYFY
ncbi:unnamed protein product [Heterobilharzia americana]|nr:unnamed protein product [Heterobilharzia americana]